MVTLPDPIKSVMKLMKNRGFEIYVVGGAVRDALLGRPVKNWDFATSATPEEILALFKDAFYNNTYGTVSIPNSVTGVLEITPFRRESEYSDFRHPSSVTWAKTLAEDLARRDFTINAIAYDGKKIIDLYEGQKHLKEKLIKTVGDPNRRFGEDALRLLRAVRLASKLGFLIADETRVSMKLNASLIKNVSWERIRDEFLKILESDFPSEGIFFLKSLGLLKYILPELDVCFSVPQKSPSRHHIYDVGTHLVMALKACPSADPITRFATLIHDIGKATTFRKDPETGLITFYNHEVVGRIMAEKISDRFRLSNQQKHQLVTLVANHQFTVSEIITDKAVRRFIRQVSPALVPEMLALRTGDRIGSGARPTSWRYELFKKRLVEVQKEPFAVKDLKVDGTDVMKLLKMKPGPSVGKILSELFDEVIEKKLENDRDALLARLKSFEGKS